MPSTLRLLQAGSRSWPGPHLSLEGVDDELQGLRLHTLDAFLHHVVPVLVLDALEHVPVQLPNHLVLWEDRAQTESTTSIPSSHGHSWHSWQGRNGTGVRGAPMARRQKAAEKIPL